MGHFVFLCGFSPVRHAHMGHFVFLCGFSPVRHAHMGHFVFVVGEAEPVHYMSAGYGAHNLQHLAILMLWLVVFASVGGFSPVHFGYKEHRVYVVPSGPVHETD